MVRSQSQRKHNVENPEIARYYAFSLGEPRFAGEQASIVELGREENMRICRIDHVDEGTHDGVFLTGEDQIKGSDTDPSDGWTAPKGSFAIAGVMKPYQLQDDELVPDQEIYSYYKYQNGADTLIYTFTPAEGSDDGSKPFSIRKPVGIKRIDTPDQEAETEAAVYELNGVLSSMSFP